MHSDSFHTHGVRGMTSTAMPSASSGWLKLVEQRLLGLASSPPDFPVRMTSLPIAVRLPPLTF